MQEFEVLAQSCKTATGDLGLIMFKTAFMHASLALCASWEIHSEICLQELTGICTGLTVTLKEYFGQAIHLKDGSGQME